MDFNLNIPVKVISGKGCVKQNSDYLKEFGSSCLIVTGGSGAKLSGALDDITEALTSNKVSFSIYDKISENPLISTCREAGTIAYEKKADYILGIGGGSALDAAKAIAIYAANPHMKAEEIYTVKSRSPALPIVAIGTTAGTGSEVGKVSVLTNDYTHRKKSISPNDCYPALTFADPTYTMSMPFSVTASTGLDALCHALEGYFKKSCTDIPTLFGEKAISLIWRGLKELYLSGKCPEYEGREQLYYGSLYAGITLAYCGTGFPHPLGYVLTENYGIPHGFACAAFLPAFMEKAKEYEPEKYSKVIKLTECTIEEFNSICAGLTNLQNIHMTADEIVSYSNRWTEAVPGNFTTSPGGYTKEEAERLFRELFT